MYITLNSLQRLKPGKILGTVRTKTIIFFREAIVILPLMLCFFLAYSNIAICLYLLGQAGIDLRVRTLHSSSLNGGFNTLF